MSVVLNPLVKWAQDRNLVHLTIELSDAVVNSLEIEERGLKFQGCGNGAQGENIYKLDVTFSEDVLPKLSTHKKNDRCVAITLRKKESKYWERLLADNNKPGWLKIDFDRWRGEDDSEEEKQEEITRISVEHRKKQMEKDLEDHVKEAEEEIKGLVIKGYLSIYNALQGIAFFYTTLAILFRLLINGSDAVPRIFDDVSDLVATCQIAAFIEPVNAAFKLVNTGVVAPLAQSIGRFIVLFLVINPHEQLQKSVLVVVLFLAWSLIENVRYPFYFLQTIGYCPKWLLWLRYTAWIPLYPLGILTEGVLIYQAASLFDAKNRWSLSLNFIVADSSIPFSFFLKLYLIILAVGGGYLLKHMWTLRVKKYGKTSRRKMKTVKKD
ncbi:very-long-chain (3R)-3-hydroxyacyl-CoA dehydratase-like [Dendronephthya gigantea]|uniref:very-long-chain (3R)-3-hydroxyacyl-CoA dehydratase-like n=1 Tax=Dendronephthya gigantea TaxID=151771 RepID=UPI00106A5782|nr:very-long-chain (3R)-3-hydroxyacyl-CoA dehydratase-like [Dendronephthya gigantea]